MNTSTKDFIEKYIDVIEQHNFDYLYKLAAEELIDVNIGELTQCLIDIQMDPSDYLLTIPDHFICNQSISNTANMLDNKSELGYGAFKNCTNISVVNIPETCECIHRECFSECINLTEVYLPKSLNELGGEIFSNCSKLTSLYYAGKLHHFNRINKARKWYEDSNISAIICTNGVIKFIKMFNRVIGINIWCPNKRVLKHLIQKIGVK